MFANSFNKLGRLIQTAIRRIVIACNYPYVEERTKRKNTVIQDAITATREFINGGRLARPFSASFRKARARRISNNSQLCHRVELFLRGTRTLPKITFLLPPLLVDSIFVCSFSLWNRGPTTGKGILFPRRNPAIFPLSDVLRWKS